MKKYLLKTVSTTSAVLHVGVTVSGNMVKAITDYSASKIAQAEGYLSSKIDNTIDSVEVAKLREEKTSQKMAKAASIIYEKRKALEEYINSKKPAGPAPEPMTMSAEDQAEMHLGNS